jgi:hypothetical protein
MKLFLLPILALCSSAMAHDTFYPKATGQGQAVSVTKAAAKFSLSCVKRAPLDYQASLVGGIKVIITSPKGQVSTIDMPEVGEANFFMVTCTMTGKGTLTIDYGKGQVRKYEGSVRASVIQRNTPDGTSRDPDTLSIAFFSPDLKVPQMHFEGNVSGGAITVTHQGVPAVISKGKGPGKTGGQVHGG